MAKIERKLLAHFINMGNEHATHYIRLGKDLEEFSPQLSAQVERSRNILGETSVVISGYEKTGEVTPFYAEEGDPLFTRLMSIVDGGWTLDQLKVDVVDVKLWKPSGTGFEAVKETAYLEVTGYGGDTTGVQIPFVLHYVGDRTPGIFNVIEHSFTEE